MEFKCRQANLNDIRDQEIILSLLTEFSHASSVGRPLSGKIQGTLIENMKKHPTTEIYIAECGREPIGIAVCFVGFSTFENKQLLNLHDFYIQDKFQGHSFGKKFLDLIEQDAKRKGYCRITLEVYAKNKRAIVLYEGLGYSGSQMEKFENLMFALTKPL